MAPVFLGTLADLKRAMTVGTVVTVTNHAWPELNGKRRVLKVKGIGIYLALPDGHPRAATTPDGSFLTWPRASGLTFHDGSVSVNSDIRGETLCTLTLE